MKSMVLLPILLLIVSVVHAQYDTVLQHKLQVMVDEDQWIRHYSDTIKRQFGSGSAEMDTVKGIWTDIENRHNILLKEIIEDFKSYPDNRLIGSEASNNFWVLVQHQDSDTGFQKKVLQLMKYALDYNQVKPSNYAYLVDRIRVNTGRKQIYGSQLHTDVSGNKLIPQPIEDSANVDKRRQEMNMQLLSDYVQYANEYFKGRIGN